MIHPTQMLAEIISARDQIVRCVCDVISSDAVRKAVNVAAMDAIMTFHSFFKGDGAAIPGLHKQIESNMQILLPLLRNQGLQYATKDRFNIVPTFKVVTVGVKGKNTACVFVTEGDRYEMVAKGKQTETTAASLRDLLTLTESRLSDFTNTLMNGGRIPQPHDVHHHIGRWDPSTLTFDDWMAPLSPDSGYDGFR